MRTKQKPTLAPYQCSHCHKVWYGIAHSGKLDDPEKSYVPPGLTLCVNCWSELDNYLYHHFKERYNLSWAYMKPEDIPFIHDQARTWIADASQKPFPPKDIYRGGNVPHWLRMAIEKGLVKTDSEDVYTVTLEDGEPVSVEVSQDRSVLRRGRYKAIY